MEYLKNTRLNSVSLSLTLLTHSIAWTGVWKLDPVFSECLQNVKTHTPPSPPTPFSPSLLLPQWLLRGVWPSWLIFFSFFFLSFFASRHLTAWHYIAPPLASLRVWGVKCTINAIFMDSIMFCLVFFFFNKYCTVCIFFLLFCVYFFFFFAPFAFNLFVNM